MKKLAAVLVMIAFGLVVATACQSGDGGSAETTADATTDTPNPAPVVAQPTATEVPPVDEAKAPAEPEPAATPEPEPTATPEPAPTSTPELTATPEPEPTAPPEPTATPESTATLEPTAVPSPEGSDEGQGRDNPFPAGSTGTIGDYDFAVIETIRGDEAWALLNEVNSFNSPPAEGNEYLLVMVEASYNGEGEGRISKFDVKLTGSSSVYRRTASVVEPDPEFDARLRSGGTGSGWVAFEVETGETNLIAVLADPSSFDAQEVAYLALSDDAGYSPNWDDIPVASDLGTRRAEPAAVGEEVRPSSWGVTVLEVIQGEVALEMLLEANAFNDPPLDGHEYVLVRLRGQNISREDTFNNVSEFDFKVTGSENVLYARKALVDPSPHFEYNLFPGGASEGWAAYEVRMADTGLMLRYEPLFSFDDGDIRYLALEDGAGVETPADPLATPTDEGTDLSSPVAIGETVVTEDLEVTVLEIVRGDRAMEMAIEANQFNDEPDEGMEYVQVRMRVRSIGNAEGPFDVNGFSFNTVGDQGQIWDSLFMVEPSPELDAKLFPGGWFEGWVTLQAGIGEGDFVLIYEPSFSFSTDNVRYLSLE